ncbi:MAG: peptidoglycan DD-metalloendopeptidase family protein [Williamsia sp.]|nr:peptidoglycan DD-metalloendopeptidase family protein [Williamsia sp.]
MKKLVLFCVMTILSASTFLQAQSRSDLERQRAAIQREIEDVRQSLNETKKNKKETLGQLSLVQKKLSLRMSEIDNINRQIGLIDGDINQSYKDIGKLKKDLDTLKTQYEKSVLYAYKNRSNYYFLNFIFSANSFNDAVRRVAYLRSYRTYREQQVATIERTQDLLEQKITGLNVNKEKKTVVLGEQNKQKQLLEVEKKEKDAVVSKLKVREKELNSEMVAKKKQDQKLSVAITAAIRRATEAAAREAAAKRKADALANASKNAAAPTTPAANAPVAKNETRVIKPSKSVFDDDPATRAMSDDFEKNRGSLPWPIESGRVSMHYGPQTIEGTKVRYDNKGITIESDAGKSVKAVFDGEVVTVMNIGSVDAVVVKHGKYFTTYSNLDGVSVSKGQQVKRGQTIGKVAEKDAGDGDLEFLISNDRDQYLNPEIWLRR